MKKKLPIIMSVVIILYAVIFIVIMLLTGFLPSLIYDNPDLIIKNFNSANKVNYRKDTRNGITTIECGRMTGMDTIWQYEANTDMALQMYYTFKVTSGKAKLILIRPDDTIITLVEQDSAVNENSKTLELGTADNADETTSVVEPMVLLELKNGKNRIKIVCEKGTAFSLSFRIP